MDIVKYKSIADLKLAVKKLRIKILNNMEKCKVKSTIWKESPLTVDGYAVDWKHKKYGTYHFAGLTIEAVIKQVVLLEIGTIAYVKDIKKYLKDNQMPKEMVKRLENSVSLTGFPNTPRVSKTIH